MVDLAGCLELVLVLSLSGNYANNLSSEDLNGGTYVAQWLESEFKSEDLRFGPLVGYGEQPFVCLSESTLAQIRLCLTPLRLYGTHPNVCAR